jgi:SAM-dependent methyltransferase
MDWAEGYFTDLDYTFGYYRELNPAMLRIACLAAGVHPPSSENPTYLELGFGQGVSINVHAAASEGEFWGTDFNPGQVSHAAALAGVSEADLSLFDDSFEELAARSDLPLFDIIALHGVWSWISERNQSIIIEFVRKRLRPGGILFISYNCQPGWAPHMPLRHLMAQHVALAGAESAGPIGKIDEALRYARKVASSGASYFAANPSLMKHMENMDKHSRNYLAHEYFNRDWNNLYFSDVAKQMSGAKLSFVASARLLDNLNEHGMEPSARQLLAGTGHPVLRETVRDFIVNQRFRMDVFSKGARRLTGLEWRHAWLQESFTLTTPAPLVTYTHQTPMGELELDGHIYAPLIDFLASNSYASKSVADICEAPGMATGELRDVLSALLTLTGLGYAQPALVSNHRVRSQTEALNLHLCQQALSSDQVSALASPVLAGGKLLSQEHQVIILAMLAGMEKPTDQAMYLHSIFEANGGDVRRGGKVVPMGEESLRQLRTSAEKFEKDGHAELLSALEIVPPRIRSYAGAMTGASTGPPLATLLKS